MKFLFFGIIQGLTEFLPISSSGHLYLLKRVTGLNQNLLPFFVLLHLATLLAIFIFFRRQIQEAIFNKKILFHLFVITVISAILALTVKYFLANFFDHKYLVSLCFLINGGILFKMKNTNQKRNYQDIKWRDSFILGVLQGISVFPGISRSGITIAAGLKRGFDKNETFNLSFLMAIPIILAAFLAEVKEALSINIPFFYIILSFFSAFLFGLLALRIIKKIFLKSGFKKFSYYCFMVFLASLIL